MSSSDAVTERKRMLRAAYRAQRRRRIPADLHAAAALLLDRARACPSRRVAAFVPVAGEPGSIAALDELAKHAEVLLPVTRAPREPLGWGRYVGAGALVPGPFGLRQPATADASLAGIDVLLVPAVAVALDGTRLGHGGGFYDQALRDVPRQRLVAVVHDDEIADELPSEPHDVPIGWACTPNRLLKLG